MAPSTLECDLIWKYGIYRDNEAKIGSLGWPLSHMTGVLLKRGHLDTDMHTGKNIMWTCRQSRSGTSPSQRVSVNYQSLREGCGADSPHSLQKEPSMPTDTCSQTLSFWNCETMKPSTPGEQIPGGSENDSSEQLLNSGYFFKGKSTIAAIGLDVKCERIREVKGDSQLFGSIEF